jgi:hypothetical protein
VETFFTLSKLLEIKFSVCNVVQGRNDVLDKMDIRFAEEERGRKKERKRDWVSTKAEDSISGKEGFPLQVYKLLLGGNYSLNFDRYFKESQVSKFCGPLAQYTVNKGLENWRCSILEGWDLC